MKRLINFALCSPIVIVTSRSTGGGGGCTVTRIGSKINSPPFFLPECRLVDIGQPIYPVRPSVPTEAETSMSDLAPVSKTTAPTAYHGRSRITFGLRSESPRGVRDDVHPKDSPWRVPRAWRGPRRCGGRDQLS